MQWLRTVFVCLCVLTTSTAAQQLDEIAQLLVPAIHRAKLEDGAQLAQNTLLSIDAARGAWKQDDSVKGKFAYVTYLSTDDDYIIGASMLGRAIKESGSLDGVNAERVAMILRGSVSPRSQAKLVAQGWKVVEVEAIEAPHPDKCGRFCDTFAKLRVWGLPYEKVLFLDSDTFVKHKISNIFQVPLAGPHQIYAVDDCGAPTINSGMFLLMPSKDVLRVMLSSLGKIEDHGFVTGGPWEFGDQVFIHFFFRPCLTTETCENNIVPAPISYNCQLHACPAVHTPRVMCHVLHFSAEPKPWKCAKYRTKNQLVGGRCIDNADAEQEVRWWETKRLWWRV